MLRRQAALGRSESAHRPFRAVSRALDSHRAYQRRMVGGMACATAQSALHLPSAVRPARRSLADHRSPGPLRSLHIVLPPVPATTHSDLLKSASHNVI